MGPLIRDSSPIPPWRQSSQDSQGNHKGKGKGSHDYKGKGAKGKGKGAKGKGKGAKDKGKGKGAAKGPQEPSEPPTIVLMLEQAIAACHAKNFYLARLRCQSVMESLPPWDEMEAPSYDEMS